MIFKKSPYKELSIKKLLRASKIRYIYKKSCVGVPRGFQGVLLKKVLVFFSIFASFFLFSTFYANAQTYFYVRPGATGNNNGTDWSNAYTSLPTSLKRGGIYYLSDGSYGSYSFNTPNSGSTLITVKKATITDHGTNMGWQDSYGDGSALFTAISFSSDYWEIDGNKGQWAKGLPNYKEHGIKITRTGSQNSKIINFPSPGSNHITIKHVEAFFSNIPNSGTWYKSMDVVYAYGSNLNFEYSWLHDGGRVIVLAIGADYMTFDHCVLERNAQAQKAMGWNPSEHSEIVMFQTDADYGVIRYSFIRDWASTGGIILYDRNDHMEFYGNIFEQTGGYTNANANGALNGLTAASSLDAVVYNNSFINLEYGASILSMGNYSKRITKNNIFYNCSLGSSNQVAIGGTKDFNWYYNSGTPNEPNSQIGTGDPFVNKSSRDYRLAASTNSGDSNIGSKYGTDPNGVLRGINGIWNRGAFESIGSYGPIELTAPSNLRIVSTQ